MPAWGYWVWLLAGLPALAPAALAARPRPAAAKETTAATEAAGPAVAADPPPSATARRGPLVQDVDLPGRLASRQRRELFAPRLPGQPWLAVLEVVPEGSTVRAGEVVVRFDPAPARRRLQHAEQRAALARLALARRQAVLAVDRLDLSLQAGRARLDLERARLLARRGVGLVPELKAEQARLDRRTAELEVAQADEAIEAFERRAAAELEVHQQKLQAAEAAVEQAKEALGRLVLAAPAAGLVALPEARTPAGREQLAAGVVVRAGEPVAELLDPARLVARVPVRPDPAAAFRPADRVSLTVPALGEARLTGRVLGVESACPAVFNGQPADCPLELVVAPQPGSHPLRPGLTVLLQVRLTLAEQALLIPARAVVTRDGHDSVWCPKCDPPGWRRVELGHRTPAQVEVLSGLQPGDQVSLDPARCAAQADPAPE